VADDERAGGRSRRRGYGWQDGRVPPIPRAPLRVAAVQAEPNPGDVAGNVVVAARLAARAAGEGARLIVLPELFVPGYHLGALHADPMGTHLAADEKGRISDIRLDPLRAVARDQNAVIVVSAAVRHADARRTNSVLVIDRRGGVLSAYDKQHLYGDEVDLFSPGTEGATLAVDGWWLGLSICYDASFPEHGRAAADDGAHGYLCPIGYLEGSQYRRDLLGAARALDNTMYVVFANQVGGGTPWRFNGGSAIYEPEGRPLRRAPDFGEHVILADFDPIELGRIRLAHRVLVDRRPDLGPARRLCRG
jgi:predicted amidohydrolase